LGFGVSIIIISFKSWAKEERDMSNNYRVHYKRGDLEIEVEATDKNYVDQMLHKLVTSSPEPPEPPKKRNGKGRHKDQLREERQPAQGQTEQDTSVNVTEVVARINDSDDYGQIENNILNKSRVLPRVLLAFHFAHENGSDFITTGDVEAITDQLRIKIAKQNVSHCISENTKYFTAAKVIRQGAKVPYKLNRQGISAFQKCLTGATR
jgi:hypothetical protein